MNDDNDDDDDGREQTFAELEELALRRAVALGRPVAVVGFASAGRATVFDYENVDGAPLEEGGLVPVADVAVTPTRRR
jgi:hypothetical protein